jgi:hypothetical protein
MAPARAAATAPPWYVSQLGPPLLALAADPSRSLADALAEAIRQVASLHPGCDLTHPGTPSATVVLLRALEERADYLALADATLLLDTSGGLRVISDERVNRLRRRAQLTRALRRTRNRPSGYWVAAADPQAASQAVTGTVPGKSLQQAVLLSDGASRLVDLFELATWEELLALLDESGPDELLRQVRAAEAVDPEGRQWPRTKRSDDATAVYLVVNRAIGIQS